MRLFLVLVLMLSTLSAACAAMTDEEVVNAMSARVGHPLKKHDVGISRPEGFPRVILVGFFAHDRGYGLEGAFVDDRYAGIDEQTPRALESAGWSSASSRAREKLALLWVERALLAWQYPLVTRPDRFGSHSFESPAASSVAGGGVRVVLWVQAPSGMRPVTSFRRVVYDFTPQGRVLRTKVLDSFEVDARH